MGNIHTPPDGRKPKHGAENGQIKEATSKGNRSKYNNQKTIVDGIVFDSKKEATRFGQLKAMEMAGIINDLKLQIPMPYELNGKKIFKYVCDFVYFDRGKNELIFEDVKGMKTPVYKLKKKLIENSYNIKITET
jgi:hypothetical protein